MWVGKVNDPEERRDLIAYLRSRISLWTSTRDELSVVPGLRTIDATEPRLAGHYRKEESLRHRMSQEVACFRRRCSGRVRRLCPGTSDLDFLGVSRIALECRMAVIGIEFSVLRPRRVPPL